VTRFAVFVATTSGPVRIERITRERAPQSMVCLRRSSTVLPISASYDGFVRRGSGVIEKTFGPFEDGAFRLDVSEPIETGESWQLGAFVAHALSAASKDGLLGAQDTAESIVWLTGQVDCDLAVGSVGHLAEKVYASRDTIAAWIALGRSVTMIVHDGPDHDAVKAAGIPVGARVVAVKTGAEALGAVGLKLPAPRSQSPERKFPARVAAAFAVFSVAGFSLLSVSDRAAQDDAQPVERMEAVTLEAAAAPVLVETAPAAASPAVVVNAPVIENVAAPKVVELPAPPHVTLVERRAPQGHTCAEVQFGTVDPLTAPIAATGEVSKSDLSGLCGLAVRVDNGGREQFVAVVLDVLSGKLLYGTSRPDILNGGKAFGGRQEWPIDLPRRLSAPFEIRVAAISADKAVAEEAQWFDTQPDTAAAAQELETKGVATAVLHHRVTP
jgi:hypothetical protein